MAAVAPVEMPVAVRAWARRNTNPAKKARSSGAAFTDLGPSSWTLVLDTESTTDAGQALRVGGYQLRYFTRSREEGLFFEPSVLSAEELETVRAYAAREGLRLLTREQFVLQVFLPTAWKRRGLIVGHNIVFDLSRLSISHHPPQSRGGRMRGGFSFELCELENASCVQVKRINSGGAFLSLTIPGGVSPEARNRQRGGRQKNHHGYFLDTATAGRALFGSRHKLERLGELLKTSHRKGDEAHGERITDAYLRYLRTDVQVTWECAVALQERFASYDLPKRLEQVYSEASVGKAHLEKMGLRPFRDLNAWPERITATVLETYYGGRAECGIRKVPVPGVYTDFTSQYPTVFTLQDLHSFLIAKRVSYIDEDPRRVRQLLDRLTVDQVFDREFWRRELPALVLIAPDGDRLPTRARYNQPQPQRGAPSDRRKGSYNVSVPFRYGGPPQWYTLADACASKLETNKAPRVLAVLRFHAHGIQDGLAPIDIAGEPEYRVDPQREDFIRRLVELRADVRAKQEAAEAAADTTLADLLEGTQQAMKCTANGTAYGSAIELNPLEHRKKAWVTVHLPDGTSHRVLRERTEEPGRWFHPLIATLVANGGRLLLATAMRLVADCGGSWALCDTDSLFIVATKRGKLIACRGGQHHTPSGRPAIKALSWQQVRAIVERFEALDPYQGPGHPTSILKIEKENYDPDTGEQREIECMSLAAKRYGLFIRRPDGTPSIVSSGDKKKRSEHGLGHLLPPNAPGTDVSDHAWLDEWWEHLLHLELGFQDHPEPVWFDQPAVGRLTVTSQSEIKAFTKYNAERAYNDQVKPWNFLITAHPAAHERALPNGPKTLIAPFERDPAKRLAANWIDRDHPTQPRRRIHTAAAPQARESSTQVLSYRDYFNQYRQHPESKALDPADRKRCHTWSRGQLQPWHITATAEPIRVGKESNRLTDTHQPADDQDEQVIEYPASARKCRGCDATVSGRRQWCSERCRKRAERASPKRSTSARKPADRSVGNAARRET